MSNRKMKDDLFCGKTINQLRQELGLNEIKDTSHMINIDTLTDEDIQRLADDWDRASADNLKMWPTSSEDID